MKKINRAIKPAIKLSLVALLFLLPLELLGITSFGGQVRLNGN